jgi:hypothetical protein
MNKKYLHWIIFVSLGLLQLSAGQKVPYQNPALSSEKRADDLIGAMTLEEKVFHKRVGLFGPAANVLSLGDYSGLVMPSEVKKEKTVEVKFSLKNTGKVKGDEAVQLYLHDELALVVRPLRELKAFKRVSLNTGESREIVLTLPYRSYGFWNHELKFGVEPGEFKVFIGRNSADTQLEGILNVQ